MKHGNMMRQVISILSSDQFGSWLDSMEGWKSLDVDYFPPRVQRLYRDLEVEGQHCRLYLHMIHTTDKPCLFHKHRWPSAIVLIHGGYEMGTAYSEKDVTTEEAELLPRAATMLMSGGCCYEMTNPNSLHYVKPIGDYSLSVMLTGPVYEGITTKEVLDKKLGPLTETEQIELLKKFKESWEKMYGKK
jgi:hypothetical protein